MQNYIGKQIDRYRIIERLGMGGMAVVYKAYDTRLERDVALKLIRVDEIPVSQHERLMKRFEREAKAMARFSHPNIVPVHDYGEMDGSPYLVMEYVPGGTLKEQTSQSVPYQQALLWLTPMADALHYAHQRGVIHRDVKPSNILIDSEGRPLLTDFGIAKILETDEATLTGTGLGVGTPEYMAPEQWLGQTSAATDQYALGVVLYELITGRKPYSADTPAAVAIMQATEPLPQPSRLVDGIPEAVEKVLYKALARKPEDRYKDMEAFLSALDRCLDGSQMPTMEEKRQSIPRPLDHIPPVSQPASESATQDLLQVAPVQKQHVVSAKKFQKDKRSFKWLWIAGGVGALFLIAGVTIGVVVNQTGKRDNGAVLLAPSAAELPANTAAVGAPAAITISTEEPNIGSTKINDVDGAEMVYVPAGEFLMGSESDEASDDEKPEHAVYLDSYWIYKHEVTNAQFQQFVEENGYETSAEIAGSSFVARDGEWLKVSGAYWEAPEGPGSNVAGREDHPVVHMSWFDAQAYCEWAGGRLPTEAEWEKAARGEDGRTYPWGEAFPNCTLAQFVDCSGQTVSVGSFPGGASPYGTLDMAGNVWEWVADWYDEDYYGSSPGQNPTGPAYGTNRVLRGGSWVDSGWNLPAPSRASGSIRAARAVDNGFRCLRSP